MDRDIFKKLGFRNVTISNLDKRVRKNAFYPFKWKYENAESLSFPSESFDYVVIHAAIHHASSPHKVLTEMYRVAKKGILAFEARDSKLMSILEKFGFSQTYEHGAVYHNECKYGGVNNSQIPNYIYRWTEREVEKTIQSYAPCFKHEIFYRYGAAFPGFLETENKARFRMILAKILYPLFYVFSKLFPKQQNLFAFYVKKPSISNSLLPWLVFDNKKRKIIFNAAWGNRKYKRVED